MSAVYNESTIEERRSILTLRRNSEFETLGVFSGLSGVALLEATERQVVIFTVNEISVELVECAESAWHFREGSHS